MTTQPKDNKKSTTAREQLFLEYVSCDEATAKAAFNPKSNTMAAEAILGDFDLTTEQANSCAEHTVLFAQETGFATTFVAKELEEYESGQKSSLSSDPGNYS